MKLSRSFAPLLVAAVVVAGLAACSATPAAPSSAKPAASAASKPTKAPVAASDGSAPSWASPLTKPGTLLTTVAGTNFKVDIYQVGTASASRTGSFADPKTNKPIIAVGDKLVYVNYVATNTSSSSISLSYNLVEVEGRYADWPYLQGMDSVSDSAQRTQLKVNDSAIAPGAPDAPYEWKSGESFSYGEDFKYEPGEAITFEATLVPAAANGDLDESKRQEVKADTKIK